MKGVSKRTRDAVRQAACVAVRGANALITPLRQQRRRRGLVASPYQRAGLRNARFARVFLDKSATFDEAQKITVWPLIRRSTAEVRIARSYFSIGVLRGWRITYVSIWFLIMLFSVPLSLWLSATVSRTSLGAYLRQIPFLSYDRTFSSFADEPIAVFAFSVIVSGLGFLLVFLPLMEGFKSLSGLIGHRVSFTLLAGSGFSLIGLGLWLADSMHLPGLMMKWGASAESLVPMSSMFLSAGLFALVYVVFRLVWGLIGARLVVNRLSVEAKIVNPLFFILFNTEGNPRRWTDARFRSEINSQLEEAATTVEVALPKILRARDAATQVWAKQKFAEIANSIRELEKWVITPQQDTLHDLRIQVAQRIACIAGGNWDGLARLPVERVTREVRMLRWKNYAATALVALAPLLLWLVLQETKVEVGSGFGEVITILTFVWAMVVLLQLLDPTLPDRVAIFKEVAGVVPGFGKGPE
jgi:hypothetical protein